MFSVAEDCVMYYCVVSYRG